MEKEKSLAPEKQPRGRALRLLGKTASLSSSVLLLGAVSPDTEGRSGETRYFRPTPAELSSTQNTSRDLEFNVASLNAHGRVSPHQVRDIFTDNDLDVLFVQEAPVRSAEILEKYTEGLEVSQVIADPAIEGLYPGQSNLVVTREQQQDISGESIDGAFLFGSLVKAATDSAKKILGYIENDAQAADSVIQSAKRARQEKRAALASTIQIQNGDKTEDIRLITGHISGVDEVEEAQRDDLKSFIEDSLKEGRTTIFCGDLNASPEVIISWFVRMGFTVMETGPTHTNGYQTLDFCAEWPGPGRERILVNARVERKYKGSDHWLVVVEGELQRPELIDIKFPRTITPEQERINIRNLQVRNQRDIHNPNPPGFTLRH